MYPMQKKKKQQQQQQQKKQANEQGNGNMSLPETQMLAYFFKSDIFSYMRSFVDAKAFLIS